MCSFLCKCHPKGGKDSRTMQVGEVGEEFSNVLGKAPPAPASMLFRQPAICCLHAHPGNAVRSSAALSPQPPPNCQGNPVLCVRNIAIPKPTGFVQSLDFGHLSIYLHCLLPFKPPHPSPQHTSIQARFIILYFSTIVLP